MLTQLYNCGHTSLVVEPGERLEALMRANKHTMKSLAAATGVSAQSIKKWIEGATEPRLPRDRRAVADELGEDPWDTRPADAAAEAEALKTLLHLDASVLQLARRLVELLEAAEGVPPKHDQGNVSAGHESWRSMPLRDDSGRGAQA